ncbi:MAG TPA: hypothetical protein VGE74_17345 [Gemmata sp.]
MADKNPRAVVEQMVRELLRALADLPSPPTLRVAGADGRLACLIQLWDAKLVMPTAGAERKRSPPGRRDECRTDILDVVRAAGTPLTRKEVVRDLKLTGKSHGVSTVVKALADLTAAGALINPKDKKGYRLPGWKRNTTPSLFD